MLGSGTLPVVGVLVVVVGVFVVVVVGSRARVRRALARASSTRRKRRYSCEFDFSKDPGLSSPHMTADVEGLMIYKSGPGTGYLLVSSQGSDEFLVNDRATLEHTHPRRGGRRRGGAGQHELQVRAMGDVSRAVGLEIETKDRPLNVRGLITDAVQTPDRTRRASSEGPLESVPFGFMRILHVHQEEP